MKENFPLILLFSIALLVFFSFFSSIIFNPFIVAGDAKIQVPFTFRSFDSDLFPNDRIINYFSDHVLPPGLIFFVPIVEQVFSFVNASFIISLFTFLASVFFLFEIGRKTVSKRVGFFLALFFILTFPTMLFSPGLTSDYGFMILFFFLNYLISKKFKTAFFSFILASLLYPPLLPILIGTSIVTLYFERKNIPSFKNVLVSLFFVIFISALILFPYYSTYQSSYDHPIKFSELSKLPETSDSYSEARFFCGPNYVFETIFREKPASFCYTFPLKLNNPLSTSLFLLFFILSIFYLFMKRGKKYLNIEFKSLFFVSVFLYVVSLISFYFLSLGVFLKPLFYGMFSFSFILLFLSANTVNDFFKKFKIKPVFILLILIFSLLFFFLYFNNFNDDLHNCERYSKSFSFVENLPKDVTIAGHPSSLGCFPLFSKRSVYLFEGAIDPLAQPFYDEMKERTTKSLDVFYSEDSAKIVSFCKDEKIDYFLVDKYYFSESYFSKKLPFIVPFNEQVIGKKGKDFFLNKLSEKDWEYSNEPIFIFSCSSFVKNYGQ